MAETPDPEPPVEPDERFPSGPWTGFFLQAPLPPGRHGMDLHLTFRAGTIRGVGRHGVAYRGYNEGKGIWGTWELPPFGHGGFHIWPLAMGNPGTGRRAEA